MGMTEMMAKAKAYDDMKNSADAKNAQVAQEVQREMQMQQEMQRQRQMNNAYQTGASHGLAAAMGNQTMQQTQPQVAPQNGKEYQQPLNSSSALWDYIRGLGK